jgi:hypothetical protein
VASAWWLERRLLTFEFCDLPFDLLVHRGRANQNPKGKWQIEKRGE